MNKKTTSYEKRFFENELRVEGKQYFLEFFNFSIIPA